MWQSRHHPGYRPCPFQPTSYPKTTLPSNTSSGINKDEETGIGVGVFIGVVELAALFAAVFLWLRRRRPSSQSQNPAAQSRLLDKEIQQEQGQPQLLGIETQQERASAIAELPVRGYHH